MSRRTVCAALATRALPSSIATRKRHGAALAYGALMLAACYNFAFDACFSPAAEAFVTRFRALVIAAVSAPLGAVAAGGLKLLDSRSSLLVLAGGSALLAVALVVDIVDFARRHQADMRAIRSELGGAIESVHERLDTIESKLVGVKRQSYAGGADGTGSGSALKP